MGMFDTIYVNYPLPVSKEIINTGFDYQGHDYQTKDLDNLLNVFTITEDGDLIERVVERVWVDDDGAFLKGYLEEVSSRSEKVKYHGIIRFYTYHSMDKVVDGSEREITISLDYEAKFTDGKLQSINLIHEEITDTTEEKKELKEVFKKMDIKNNKWYNKYIFHTKTYHKFVTVFIFNPLRKARGLLDRLYIWAIRTF